MDIAFAFPCCFVLLFTAAVPTVEGLTVHISLYFSAASKAQWFHIVVTLPMYFTISFQSFYGNPPVFS